MKVTRDDTVRTIVLAIEDGPDLIAGWATWRTKTRAFQLEHVRITVDAGELRSAVLSGHLRLKAGNLSATLTDAISFHPEDLKAAPVWVRMLVLDAVSNITNAGYPTPENQTLGGRWAGGS